MFDAPGLPEPSWRMSRPPARATSPALGNVPTRYATGIRHPTTSTIESLSLFSGGRDDGGPGRRYI